MRRLPTALVVALTLGLGLSACAEDPIEPPPLAGSSGTPSPSLTDSPTPSGMRADNPQDTIRDFIAAKIKMENSGDATDFLALSRKSCEYCNNISGMLIEAYNNGGKFSGNGGWKIKSIKKRPGVNQFAVSVNIPPSVYIASAGESAMRLPGSESVYNFDLAKQGDRWLVEAVAKDG